MSCNSSNLAWVGPAPGYLDNSITIDIGGYNSRGQWTFLTDSSELIQACEFRPYKSVPFQNVPCECGGTLTWALAGGSLPPGLSVNAAGGYVEGTVSAIFGVASTGFYTDNSNPFVTSGSPATETIGDNAYITKRYDFTINASTDKCSPVARSFYIIVVKLWDAEEQAFVALNKFKNPTRTGAPYV